MPGQRRLQVFFPLSAIATAVVVLVHGSALAAGLPVACVGGAAACKGLPLVNPGNGGVASLVYGTNALTINQSSSTAILNWQSFNIGAGNLVQFVQPSASSVALNRIFDPNVTTIAGNLKANGQVYLINPNGILFGSHAVVNVAGLIASTLDVNDLRITNGFFYDPLVTDPVFSSNLALVGDNPATTPTASAGANPSIIVMPGASLYAAGRNQTGTVVSPGRIFLFAPDVQNGGSITVDGGGQVILASGADVYLGSSSDPQLRGLLVEVSAATGNDIVSVNSTGSITAAHGDITLMGLAVNQAGTVMATSALDDNGSIRLIARVADPTSTQTPAPGSDVLITPLETGKVTLASGSKTEVVLDTTDTATAPLSDPTAAASRSTIDIEGQSVTIGGTGAAGSTVVQAHGGDITVTARSAASNLANGGAGYPYFLGDGSLLGAQNPAATIDVGADALIDASGLQNVPIDGALYFAYISRLTSSNLANAPYQRAGFLLGQPVYVNLNNVPSWLDVTNLQAAVATSQAQRDTVAGTVSLLAEGAVNLAHGSVVNVSGGTEQVSAAIGRTSQLLTASGSVVDISNASADVQYVGFADGGSQTVSDPIEGVSQTVTWQAPHYSSMGGYLQGSNAGTLEIYAPSANLGGTLLGSATTGLYQRSAPPSGGLLRINSDSAGVLDQQAGFSRPDILLAGSTAALGRAQSQLGNPNAILLDTTTLVADGFNRFNLTSDGLVDVVAGGALNLGNYGQLTIVANAASINASIIAPGGSISMSERPVTSAAGNGSAAAEREQLNLITNPAQRGLTLFAPGTSVDVAGLWTNDAVGAGVGGNEPIVLNGGSISITDRTVNVSDSSFNVSSGADLSIAGVFSGGSGGSLSLAATNRAPAGTSSVTNPALIDTGVLDLGSNFAARVSGFGVKGGGTLSIGAPTLYIGGVAPLTGSVPGASAPVQIDNALADTGFEKFAFGAYESIEVAGTADFFPQVASFYDSAALNFAPSTASLLSLVKPQLPQVGSSPAASIVLSASSPLDGNVRIDTGAVLDAAPGGSIAVTAAVDIDMAGSLVAKGGSVSLTLASPNPNNLGSLDALDARALVLTDTATIDVSGASLVTTNAQGLRTGSVQDGGTVSLDANIGSVAVDAGARIRAGGTVDQVDVLDPGGVYLLQSDASSGGVVEMSATTGLTVLGSVSAAAGSNTANGGRLSIALQAPSADLISVSSGAISSTAVIQALSYPTALVIGTGPTAASNPPAPLANNATGYITSSLVNSSGFAQVWLQSADSIRFDAATSLSTRQSLVLAAQSIDLPAGNVPASVSLDAPFVALGTVGRLATSGTAAAVSSDLSNNVQQTATAGNGTLTVNAGQIDLVGSTSLVNVQQATLNATGTVVGIGVGSITTSSPRSSGALRFAGNLAIDAAALLPSTQTDFTFQAVSDPAFAAGGNLSITTPAGAAALPAQLTAGGTMNFDVGNFRSAGRVLAPQGQISLAATGTVELDAGSVLSTAGSALVPFGSIINGTTWTYAASTASSNLDPWTIGSATGVSVQSRGININAPTINAEPGSQINVSGGGDLLGAGFVAGPGGSYNYSANFPFGTTTGRNPYFAIVPTLGTSTAPFDTQIYSDLLLNPALPAGSVASFQIGQTFTVAAGSALPAGTYTILPPAYALLPGAYAVLPASGYQNFNPGSVIAMPDGTQIVAGKLGFADAGTISSLWSGFRIYNNAQFNTLSQFQDGIGSQFLAAAAAAAGQPAPRLGPDAGALLVDAGSDIRLAGDILAAPAAGGRGASLDFVAPSLVVVDGAAAPTSQPGPELAIGSVLLTNLNAESLILGAVATRSDEGATLSVASTTSTVAVQAGARLGAGEIVLAGTDVSVGAGATLSAVTTQAPQTTSLDASGNGALVYVGNAAALPAYTRTGASAAGTASVGTLEVGTGATLAGAAVLLDATQGQTLADNFTLQASNTEITALQFNLGDAPAGTSGLTLTPSLLGVLSGAGNLTLASDDGFAAFGSAQLGALGSNGVPLLNRLTLIGPGIAGFGGAGTQVVLTAGDISLQNRSGAVSSLAGTGASSLTLDAIGSAASDGSIQLGGTQTLSGFSSVNLSATGVTQAATSTAAASTVSGTGEVRFTGNPGDSATLSLQGTAVPLTISAARITAQSGVDASVTVPGSLVVAASGPAPQAQQSQIGASLSLSAQQIDMGGRIDLPGGVVQLSATGPAATDGISLDAGSLIRVAGVSQTFASTTADVAAGAIVLSSAAGNVVQQAGSVLDLSGAGTLGNAGSLAISAPQGSATIGGNWSLASAAGTNGASVSVDANVLDFGGLVATIGAGAGGAGNAALQSVDIRARSGNLTLASGSSLRAGTIVLEADGAGGPTDGTVTVAGTLDASGRTGGEIALYANDQVLVQAGAVLDASASGAGLTGGDVVIASRVTANAAAPSTLDAVVLDPNATMSVAGGSGGSGGTITLRANAVGYGSATGADVEIAPLPVAMLGNSGARQIVVEGAIVDSTSGPLTITSGLLATDSAALSTYMSAANRSAMSTRLLGGATLSGFSLRPDLEIDASGDITLATQIDFATGLTYDATSGITSCATTCAWRYGGNTIATSDPGLLTLRSAGNVFLDASISDGFLPTSGSAAAMNGSVWRGAAGESWSYILTAGADLNASNPNQVVAGTAADLLVGVENGASPYTVRTGTGSIALNASEDVVLNNGFAQQTNVVYSAGIASIPNLPSFPQATGFTTDLYGDPLVLTSVTPVLTRNGGNLQISAGRDILGTAQDGSNPDGSQQSVNEWLLRGGTGSAVTSGTTAPTVWWVQFDQFQQGFGALGGGNLSLSAGRDIVNVGAVVPGVGYDAGAGVVQFNNGSLSVQAAGNVSQGLFYDQSGTFNVQATAFVGNPAEFNPALATPRFAQGDNSLDIQARLSSTVTLAFNPTAVDSSQLNTSLYGPQTYKTDFFTFGPDSAQSIHVTAGDLQLVAAQAASNSLNGDSNSPSNLVSGNWTVTPGTLDIVAYDGSINLNATPVMYPAALGQLRLLAGADLLGDVLQMSQAQPSLLGTPANPVVDNEIQAGNRLLVPVTGTVPLHAGDTVNAEVVARTGSIDNWELDIPKSAEIVAGQDIGPNIVLNIQNDGSSVVSLVSAGNTIDLSGSANLQSSHIFVGGPGAAEILSGGAMNLGIVGPGIVSRGNLDNANLSAQGASLVVASGVGLNGAGLAAQPDFSGALQNFVRYDAFAAAGSDAAGLDAQVIAAIAGDANLGGAAAPLAQALSVGLADRSSVNNPNSAVRQAIAALTPAQLVEAGVTLASSIQVVNNQRFVSLANQDTFAPGYAAFDDLFPNLYNNTNALAQFILNNPFSAASNAAQLREQALAGLPPALVNAIQIGLASPSTVDDPNSAYARAIAAIDPAQLASGARALLSNVLTVAGTSLDALKASGQLVGTGTPYATQLTKFASAYSPASAAGRDDLQMDYNQITAEQTGSVSIFAPQGSVIVGQATAQVLGAGQTAKSAAELGIFTVGGGNIVGMVRDDFNVFESRVFTVAGGDIDLWSSLGNLDAGKGPRDVAVASPPRIVTDPSTGLEFLDFSAAVSGSGIGALKTEPDQPPSNINLIAPLGYVDAGEAGIRAQAGTVTLGTNLVLNATNIQAASGVSGGAVVASPPPPAPPSAVSSAGEKALEAALNETLGQQAAEQRSLNQQRMRVFGEFLGFGEADDEDDPCSGKSNPDACRRERAASRK